MRRFLAAKTVAAVLWALLVAAEPSLLGAQPVYQDRAPWRVLILHGSDIYVPGSVLQIDALREALSESAAPRLVTFEAEVLDAVRFDSTAHEPELLALLQKKHHGLDFDLVMPMGDAALGFAERHREALWPGVAIVFFSVAPDALRERPLGANATGVTIDFARAAATARRTASAAPGWRFRVRPLLVAPAGGGRQA